MSRVTEARIFTAAKDSVKDGKIDKVSFMHKLGCDDGDERVNMMVDNFIAAMNVLAAAAAEATMSGPELSRRLDQRRNGHDAT